VLGLVVLHNDRFFSGWLYDSAAPVLGGWPADVIYHLLWVGLGAIVTMWVVRLLWQPKTGHEERSA